MSVKSVTLFGVTLAQSNLNKSHVYDILEIMCSRIVVSEEKHSDGGIHFHLFMDTLDKLDKYTVEELYETIRDLLYLGEWEGESIRVEPMRSTRTWLIYITKEDESPLFKNVDEGVFSMSYKVMKYIRENREFCSYHVFVRTHMNMMKHIENMHREFWTKAMLEEHQNEAVPVQPDIRVSWVADFKDSVLINKRSIFCHGYSGVGKSLITRYICREFQAGEILYLPCGSTEFEFSDVAYKHKLIIAEDVSENYFEKHRQMLLQILNKMLISINKKCAPITTIKVRAQMIILSNYKIVFDEALARRLKVIHANRDGFQEKLQEEN